MTPDSCFQIAKPRNNVMGSYQNTFNRGQLGNNTVRTPINIGNMGGAVGGGFRARGRSPLSAPRGVPILRGGGVMPRHTSPILMQSNFAAAVSSCFSILKPTSFLLAMRNLSNRILTTFVWHNMSDSCLKPYPAKLALNIS